MRASQHISIATPLDSRWSPTPAWKPACGTKRATCCARGRSRSCWRLPCRESILTPSVWSCTATACSRSPWKSATCLRRSRQPSPAGQSGAAAADDRRRIRRLRIRRDQSLRRYDSRLRRPIEVQGVFAPGFKPMDPDRYSPDSFHPVGLKAIDHIVANVEEGKMGDWVDYYKQDHGLFGSGQL